MKHPRFRELVLLLGVAGLFFVGLVQVGERGLLGFFVFLGIFGALHVTVRILAPLADPILLPIAAFLTALGLLELAAIDLAQSGTRDWRPLAPLQAAWLAAGAAAFIITLYVFRGGLGPAWRFRYTIALLALAATIAPLIPGIGYTVNGARLWLRLGPLNFQPGEAAKVLIVLFLAAYLAERRELLGLVTTRRIGPIHFPDPRYAAPLAGLVGLALLIFVRQNDLGSSLLFFVTFMSILWVATGRALYPIAGLGLFGAGVFFALQRFNHVRVRFDAWLDPFAHPQTTGFQIVRAWYAMAEGKMGGLGLAGPDTQLDLIPFGWTDLILTSISYTLGLAGTIAVVIAFVVFLTRCYFIALRSRSDLHALAAAGFGTVVGVQACLIAGGVTRVLPLTGVTLPFVSYGGSSLLANFVILGCLLAISNSEATTTAGEQAREEAMV